MFDLSQIVKDWKESAALHAHINLYGFWDEETFLTKSGDLGVVLRVRGIDYESLDSTSRDHAVKRLEAALRTFDPRVRVYQALFKTNQPEIPHQKYANRLVNAAIDQRMAYFAAKAEHLFSVDLYWIVVVQGGYAKSSLQQTLRQLPAHPHSFLRDIHALFSQVRQRAFLQTQIERDHVMNLNARVDLSGLHRGEYVLTVESVNGGQRFYQPIQIVKSTAPAGKSSRSCFQTDSSPP